MKMPMKHSIIIYLWHCLNVEEEEHKRCGKNANEHPISSINHRKLCCVWRFKAICETNFFGSLTESDHKIANKFINFWLFELTEWISFHMNWSTSTSTFIKVVVCRFDYELMMRKQKNRFGYKTEIRNDSINDFLIGF